MVSKRSSSAHQLCCCNRALPSTVYCFNFCLFGLYLVATGRESPLFISSNPNCISCCLWFEFNFLCFKRQIQDTQYIVEVGLVLSFWLSPVVYPWTAAHQFLSTLPFGSFFQELYMANPFGLVVMSAQQALWPPINTPQGQSLQFFDSPFATRLWLSVLASWIFLYIAQRIFARMAGTVVVDL